MSTTHTFRVEGMHCASCGLLIDETLEDLPGVATSQTSMKQGRSVVELVTNETTSADLITAIAELGYTAHPMS
ncbi:MAG: heavy-metal-associated domain-containing protein [Pseudonocardia sp.]|uniref:cation transporter n=1 Tax=Pseudonocardia sp. TaxID=60912 RepID=UPI001AD4F118|nr:heavy metal-associated domain-containing protein [Pseudonocardia sp.]MBN9098162.1 heavy-metal-associated domain-containing protein [Pseudonocardia sp.]